MDMQNLYNQYPVTQRVLQEKGAVAPEVQKKRNQTNRLGKGWFENALEAKDKKAKKTR